MNAKTFKLVQQTALLLTMIISTGCQPDANGNVDTTPWYVCGSIVAVVAFFLIGRFVLSRKKTGVQSAKPVVDVNDRIAKQPAETAPKAGTARIFVSYRRSDSADIAGRIYDRLIDRFGKEPIFKDVDSIPLGLDFKEYLDKKVGECDVLLAIIGDRWLDASNPLGKNRLEDPTDFVRIEIESALERGIPVIPLLVRGAEMPHEEMLPPGLRKLIYRNGIPIRSDPDFHRDMDRLISALEKYIQ